MLSQLLFPPHHPLPDFSASEMLLKISTCLRRDGKYRSWDHILDLQSLNSFGYTLMPSSSQADGICLMYTTPLDQSLLQASVYYTPNS